MYECRRVLCMLIMCITKAATEKLLYYKKAVSLFESVLLCLLR